ncbi:chromate efflux transporter [Ferrimonas aestuarii]|uniref:Chromate efflux transporter n=1 Tax=Ferrimonas aestuarii TaxID=2569539 RepID=A0A4U1BSM7_9GAMM|nr:chromate efflux transporter [Ferrimonas aestuarii]TKB58707.1 chromate efflux transporter [Ferrimonas aestuarii]
MFQILKTFFLLGCVSFGGPAAHIGYFRKAFVEQRRWLSEHEFANLVALSQFLPGPGSSQLGFAIGHGRGGLAGAIAAFVGFTLPSVLLMMALAWLSQDIMGNPYAQGIIHGLKLLAVVVVADAVLGMFANFCRSNRHRWLCVISAASLLLLPSLTTQIGLILMAGLIGMGLSGGASDNTKASVEPAATAKPNWLPLALFAALWLLPLVSAAPISTLFSQFYHAGSLVFGGGHVVLPLLQSLVGEHLSSDSFLTGYAAAQAVPGPMFALATYLGWFLPSDAPALGAVVATVAIFLPGFLLLLGLLNSWQSLASQPKFVGASAAINAAVTGILLSALYQPVFSSAVVSATDMAMVLLGFALLRLAKPPISLLILLFVVTTTLSKVMVGY